jgi:hypothetical protein
MSTPRNKPPSWILVHNEDRYKDSKYESPQDELVSFKPGWLWQWKWTNPLKEDGRHRRVLLAWEMKVFGEATVSVTHEVENGSEDEYNFSFVLHQYERLNEELPFDRLPLGKRRRHHHGLIRLDEKTLAAYHAHRRRVGVTAGCYTTLSATPEVATVEVAVVGAPRSRKGQGLFLNTEERRCIDERGMKVAKRHLKNHKFHALDVSKGNPCDFLAKKGDTTFVVEVKSTTTDGRKIILTKGEVKMHRARHPDNMLLVVHSIRLDRTGAKLKASGGKVRLKSSWMIEQRKLKPLAYTYEI